MKKLIINIKSNRDGHIEKVEYSIGYDFSLDLITKKFTPMNSEFSGFSKITSIIDGTLSVIDRKDPLDENSDTYELGIRNDGNISWSII